MNKYGLQDFKTLEVIRMMFYYWLGRFGIRERIRVITDLRLKDHMSSEFFKNGTIELRINHKQIRRDWDLCVLVSGIMHEIGHILIDGKYDTEEEIVYEEWRAETFALTMLRYFYPDFHKRTCQYYRKILKSSAFKKKHPLHYKAFSMIREYTE